MTSVLVCADCGEEECVCAVLALLSPAARQVYRMVQQIEWQRKRVEELEGRLMEFQGAPQKKPIRVGTVEHIDRETGEVTKTERNAGILLPPPPNVCQECGRDHPHENPHDQRSLYYQMQFQAKHGRYPTWTDAMAHCPESVRVLWKAELIKVLKELGLAVPADLLEDTPGGGR